MRLLLPPPLGTLIGERGQLPRRVPARQKDAGEIVVFDAREGILPADRNRTVLGFLRFVFVQLGIR